MAASSISGGVTSPMSCFPQRNPAPGRRLDRSVMLAKQLSNLLTELIRHGDVTTDTPRDMDKRLEALRGCGLLPRGRENRGRALTIAERADVRRVGYGCARQCRLGCAAYH